MDKKVKNGLERIREVVREHGDALISVLGLVGAETLVAYRLHCRSIFRKKLHSNNWLKLHGYPMRRKNHKKCRAH